MEDSKGLWNRSKETSRSDQGGNRRIKLDCCPGAFFKIKKAERFSEPTGVPDQGNTCGGSSSLFFLS
uniref:Uncharacterized protein n=1 Tax=Chromera velia CCMP2878 TaxID=1169474 RepID=A0A0G4HXX6_9ALVE|eukprot:Cvel_9371.t1-p1 / transcript=Cvel_9371.t1 / gene=Cvel_9371 / organism=Chromera_velia_CCMP2878 / gene_product=hypothetical protein / transcript_product=hypothetical protein / location=Cvel_scaffold538:24511-25780(+) / protein_length=66 / sequence_SO=supercontig / SO=protein_coding / is_pseudo=false